METKELADELMIWLPKLSAGKTLEARDHIPKWYKIKCLDGLIVAIRNKMPIRLKQIEFPTPPDGETWANPDNLTAEQIGTEYGYRLLLVSELDSLREDLPCQIWTGNDTVSKWTDGVSGGCVDKTYRVNANECPVGSLKPVTDLSREVIEADIIKDLLAFLAYAGQPGCTPIKTAEQLLDALKSGKINHLEIKYG